MRYRLCFAITGAFSRHGGLPAGKWLIVGFGAEDELSSCELFSCELDDEDAIEGAFMCGLVFNMHSCFLNQLQDVNASCTVSPLCFGNLESGSLRSPLLSALVVTVTSTASSWLMLYQQSKATAMDTCKRKETIQGPLAIMQSRPQPMPWCDNQVNRCKSLFSWSQLCIQACGTSTNLLNCGEVCTGSDMHLINP